MVCLPSVTQCSKCDVAFGLDQKKSSLRLKSVILWQKIRDFGFKYRGTQQIVSMEYLFRRPVIA